MQKNQLFRFCLVYEILKQKTNQNLIYLGSVW